MASARQSAQSLLASIDVRIGGDRPWDLRVLNERLYDRLLAGGALALGESYMDGWWECDRIDELVVRLLTGRIEEKVRPSPALALLLVRAGLLNLQRYGKAFNIGRRHYDLGNDLYETMLDRGMNYSCAYWERAATLDDAQQDKLELICAKIGLAPGMRVLDIGCGWGGFAQHAAERHGARVVGITVSREQVSLARKRCEGLPVEIRLQDYRDMSERFDRIVSVGMIEHVGYKNYRTYMEVAARCLAPDGLFLLHTIGSDLSTHANDPWTDRYIFPDGMLPSAHQLAAAAEGLFKLEDWHSFGHYYDRTLCAWYANFEAGWPKIGDRYGERFRRMWRYYLLSSAGSFRARHIQLWQIVFSPIASTRVYDRVMPPFAASHSTDSMTASNDA